MTAPRLPRADRGVREVLRIADIGFAPCAALLTGFDLDLQAVADSERIPGSYWGECEAGLIGNTVYARAATPIHSLLHEACQLTVMPADRRSMVHTDATTSIAQKDAPRSEKPRVGTNRVHTCRFRWSP